MQVLLLTTTFGAYLLSATLSTAFVRSIDTSAAEQVRFIGETKVPDFVRPLCGVISGYFEKYLPAGGLNSLITRNDT
ncbi:hypothetical protein [Alteromonas sp. ASW11-130]|uniref:hypothetical protein n=1 Tax=Alteromonas sp. ASW11-130 TaxID=3015775 RepID=UPI0022422B92|nr:hypothetical protein [Alteromonas sp. ASW11-130]MCW8092034.1 hypothetical protein [Alteromonas sp. ASW11-130]